MNQIFRRINKIIKSNLNSNENNIREHLISNNDDDLKKIIEELNNSKSNNKNESHYNNKDNESKSHNYNSKQSMSLTAAYKLFELNQDSSVEELKSAYKRKINEYHPDKVEKLGAEIKELALEKTRQINEAWSVIKKDKKI